MIRSFDYSDIDVVSRLYMDFMFESSLKLWGRSFIKLILEGIIDAGRSLQYVYAASDGRVLGFIAVTMDTGNLLSAILRRKGLRLAACGIASMAIKPSLIGQLGQFLTYSYKTKASTAKAELLFIIVHPDSRGQGIAHELIRRALTALYEIGIGKVKVTFCNDNYGIKAVLSHFFCTPVAEISLNGKQTCLYEVPTNIGKKI